MPAGLRQPHPKQIQYHELPDGSRYLLWKDMFEFHIAADAQVVTALSLDGAPEKAFRTYMLGHLLSYALLGMGYETIHAASVVMDGAAIGFLGDSARGKSTLAAAFLQVGCSLLSDDFLVLGQDAGDYIVYPGFPRIKLYERVSKHLVADRSQGTPMNADHCPKMVYPIEEAVLGPVPLRVFYSLTSPKSVGALKQVRIDPLNEKEAYLELLENSFNVKVRTPQRLTTQFRWATELVKRVPIKRLSYPRVLTILPDVIEAVKADLADYAGGGRSALTSTLPTRTP